GLDLVPRARLSGWGRSCGRQRGVRSPELEGLAGRQGARAGFQLARPPRSPRTAHVGIELLGAPRGVRAGRRVELRLQPRGRPRDLRAAAQDRTGARARIGQGAHVLPALEPRAAAKPVSLRLELPVDEAAGPTLVA